jgi:hypothetical protein
MMLHCIHFALWAILAAPGTTTGPDLITQPNNLFSSTCVQFGRQGVVGEGMVGLGVAPTACNNGDEAVHWFQLPDTDHPVIFSNLYRLSSTGGYPRFEHIGLSWLKHGFGAAQFDECGLGCGAPNPDNTQLGVGCSDPYVAGQSAQQCNLAARSVVHPYTGAMPEGAFLGAGGGCNSTNFLGNFPASDHRDHVHTPVSHLLQVQDVDLMPPHSFAADYFVEIHYICPHEFTAGNGNQHNNASHRQLGVSGPDGSGVFTFVELSDPISESAAIDKWTGATQRLIEPNPGVDGRGFLAYEVTQLDESTWHYEYALYNMNMDQSFGRLTIPIGVGVTLTNVEFHAPRNHDPEPHADDYTNTAWTVTTTNKSITWETESFAANPMANAVRYGTLYNFRFDADSPPADQASTVGFFKPGTPTSTIVIASGPAHLEGIPAASTWGLVCIATGLIVAGSTVLRKRLPKQT